MIKKWTFLCLVAGGILLICVGIVVLFLYCFPLKYRAEIIKFSAQNGLSPVLVASVINAESRFDPTAKSQKGAIGLMQLLPTTAEEIAKKLNIVDFSAEDLLVPEINIAIGTYYLAQMLAQFGDEKIALCGYNAGPKTVRGWLANKNYSADGTTLTQIPYSETQKYTQKIAFYQKFYAVYF